jgi:hypothetical protein
VVWWLLSKPGPCVTVTCALTGWDDNSMSRGIRATLLVPRASNRLRCGSPEVEGQPPNWA